MAFGARFELDTRSLYDDIKHSGGNLAPTWMNVSLAMRTDPAVNKAFGWVLEMYAYIVSSAVHDVGNILHKDSMLQEMELNRLWHALSSFSPSDDAQLRLTTMIFYWWSLRSADAI
ncbi:hypothetical protein L1987_13455 [Smallanthus sonchifolius]|uniref:Uncharacterized protein n=1 Tax=Smallanthus sonchifolius TaxID=185202 RepID=A0ACB9JH09_9ASTR|nr:hypothetical protein L1987_13455 [Smallanthus sonchifolius]